MRVVHGPSPGGGPWTRGQCYVFTHFEMVCVEFLSRTDKNTVCCCVHRHPNTDVQEFLNLTDIQYLLEKVTKERKSVFLMSDFNLNPLNYETHSDTNTIMNSVISYSLLPYITTLIQSSLAPNCCDLILDLDL